MLLLITAIAFAFAVSSLCSILEACLLSLSTTDIALLSERKPLVARIWRGFKENIQPPIAVILIVNTLAHTIGATVSGAQFNHLFGSKWIVAYSLAFSFAMIQWTEILPKTLAVQHNRYFAALLAVPMKWAVTLFHPLVSFLELLNRPFEGPRRPGKPDALSDIEVLARFAAVNNLISREQESIVSRSIQLTHARIRDIMVAREDIKYLSTSMTMVDALVEAHIHHHTRYILIDGQNLDQVVGYVNVKDIVSALQINPQDPSLRGIARPVPEIRVTQSVPELLKALTKGYQHIAIVRDEKGRTAGLVTLEDVVETIVGDIEDEYDVLPTYVYRLAEGRFLAGGGVPLADLKVKTGWALPELKTPLHEWLSAMIKGKPAVEIKVPFQDQIFILRKIRRSKIHEVIVEKQSLEAQKLLPH